MTALFKNARPETLSLWNYLRATFAITAIAPVYFQGGVGGSEFLTYAANKLYFCLSMVLSENTVGVSNSGNSVVLYNQANAAFSYLRNDYPAWDATASAMRYVINDINVNDLFFSRLSTTFYDTIIFNGYRLTI